MIRRFKHIFNIIQSEGIIVGLRWLFQTIYHRAIPQKQIIWFADLTEIDDTDFCLPAEIEIRRYTSRKELSKEDYEALVENGTALMGSAARILIDQRLEKGATLWLLKENGSLAGYRWTIVKDTLLGTYVPHTDLDVHEFGVEVFSGYRGRNVFQVFVKHALITLKNEGYKRFFTEVHIWNARSMKAMSKTDLKKIGLARRFQFWGRNIVIWCDIYNKKEKRKNLGT
jgi:RimJ/RimL family protein N-acetyltransferase